jgi:hypothetical protein
MRFCVYFIVYMSFIVRTVYFDSSVFSLEILMNFSTSNERDRLYQKLGEIRERVQQLGQLMARQSEAWESDAKEWLRLQRHKQDLAEWLVDEATNDSGTIVDPRIDAALGGETFVPCTIRTIVNGKRYCLTLVSTCYDVKEI